MFDLFHFLDGIELGQPSVVESILLQSLGGAVSQCPLAHILAHKLPARLVADHETNLPDELQTVLNHFCPLLLSPNRATQLAAYKILLNLVPTLPKHDVDKEREEDKEKEEITRYCIDSVYVLQFHIITICVVTGTSIRSLS